VSESNEPTRAPLNIASLARGDGKIAVAAHVPTVSIARMAIFLLIRHAQNDWIDKRIAGWTPGVHLNDAGRRQADVLVERLARLPLAAIYSSPLERTLETAAPLARARGLVVQPSDDFGEIRYGAWTGLELTDLRQRADWKRFVRGRSHTRVPDGELMLELQLRMVAGIERLRAHHGDDTVAIVSHGDPIRTAIAHYAGIPLDLYPRLDIAPASISILSVGDEGPRLLRMNDTGVLDVTPR
jgi:probable phosphoglycerate mutase